MYGKCRLYKRQVSEHENVHGEETAQTDENETKYESWKKMWKALARERDER